MLIRQLSLVVLAIGTVLGWVAFGLAWNLPKTLSTRLETYNQADQRQWTLSVDRGRATYLPLIGAVSALTVDPPRPSRPA